MVRAVYYPSTVHSRPHSLARSDIIAPALNLDLAYFKGIIYIYLSLS